jgi:serine/threonine-protein kinase
MNSILPERVTLPPSDHRDVHTPPISKLPADILMEGGQRLGTAGLIYSMTFSLAWLGPGIIGGHALDREFLLHPRSLAAMVSILVALVVALASQRQRIRIDRLMDLGLVFLVVSTFGISMANFWGAFPVWTGNEFGSFIGIPWECVWIIIFPLIAPNAPLKTLIASLAAASTGILTLLLSQAFGQTSRDLPLSLFLGYFLFTTYLCAGLAYVTSRGIYKVGARLEQARSIGSYQLEKLLGSGGMGEVWVAKHRLLARPAAIKLIRPESLGTNVAGRIAVARRFEREAQATAALQSYHTISLYDFGVAQDGSFFYVMELLHGMNLDELIRVHGPIPAARAVHLLRQVCHSLDDAHRHGMIHRDIKPANIFLCRLGSEFDFIKVLDFGLVRTPKALDPGATDLTVEGMTYGTPGYMPPEIAMGRTDLDGRADLYGLGCVAYWLLTGQRVFLAETPMAEALHHIQSKPVPPSQRTKVMVPEALDAAILACLEKEPARRPATARDLEALLAHAVPAGGWDQRMAEEWWRQHVPEKHPTAAE